jgi:amino acid transporter
MINENVESGVVGSQKAGAGEDLDVSNAGYRPQLRRTLRFFSVFGVSFSIISITTGIFLNYGWGLSYLGTAAIWTWPVVVAGNLLVAFVLAELSTRIRLAGYAYQWSSRLMNSTYGWFVGFFGLLYMAVGGPSIILLAASPVLLSIFGVSAPSSHLLLSVAIILMLLTVLINVLSVQLVARINNIAVFTEIAGTVIFSVLLVVLWGVRGGGPAHYGFGILTNTTSLQHNALWYSLALALLLGAYTITGFELAADFSEEAVNARHTIPRAIIWAVVASGVFGMIALVGFTLAIPNLKLVEGSGLPLVTIAQYWLPEWGLKIFLIVIVYSMFSIVVMGAAAQARLAFSLARDNMLPFSKFLARVNVRTKTPIVSIIVFGLFIDIGVMIYGYLQTSSFGVLVGATAIIPYILYFLINLAYSLKRKKLERLEGDFSLGRWSTPIIVAVFIWTAFLIVVLSVPAPFHGSDRVVVGAVVLATLWYLFGIRPRLRAGTAGVKPIEDLTVDANQI